MENKEIQFLVCAYVVIYEACHTKQGKRILRQPCSSLAEAYTLCEAKGQELRKNGYEVLDENKESTTGTTYLAIEIRDSLVILTANDCYYKKIR